MRHGLCALLLLALAVTPAAAKRRSPPTRRASPAAEKRSAAPAPAADRAASSTTDGQSTAPPSGKPPKVKVYSFSGLDVEGKLKTPQLLYFLNRIKAEFDTSTLDKRSFMKELDRSADDPSL